MRHGISEQDWLEFVDGTLDSGRSRKIEQHVAVCPGCAGLRAELEAWHEILREEASRLQLAIDCPEDEVDRMLETAIERIHKLEPAGIRTCASWTTAEALMLMRSLLEPFCGVGTACATMNLAARRASAGEDGEVTGRNWPVFVSNLSEALASVCGMAAARLVDRAGLYVAVQGI
jgi:anti-sigma factor RsiW